MQNCLFPQRWLVAAATLVAAFVLSPRSDAQQLEILPATTQLFPSQTDSNSPSFWQNGTLSLYNSYGYPVRSQGADQFNLGFTETAQVPGSTHYPLWIESTWKDDDGIVYAWYHHEPAGVCGSVPLTAPEIGALVSQDGGSSFRDLGIVLRSGDSPDCSAQNGYFAGGHGDFSVIPSQDRQYFYFFFGNYGGDLSQQGVAVARMAFEHRSNPAGNVWKYREGSWNQPGLGGTVTPVFPSAASWSASNTDSFWGPSIHWNTYLSSYVVLLNRSCCDTGWPQEGVYITFNPNLEDVSSWTPPVKILDNVGWYPQVIGMNPGETDQLAGQVARLYVFGTSDWVIRFGPAPAEGEVSMVTTPQSTRR